MNVKEYVRVVQNDCIIIKRNGFKGLREMVWLAKLRGLQGKFEIEYLVRVNKDLHKYAIYTFKDFMNISGIFPHGCYK